MIKVINQLTIMPDGSTEVKYSYVDNTGIVSTGVEYTKIDADAIFVELQKNDNQS